MITENSLYNIETVFRCESERVYNNYADDYASLIWYDDSEEYIIVFWCETWNGCEVEEIKFTGCDDLDRLLDKLYVTGYME